jgi:hypothetical protein
VTVEDSLIEFFDRLGLKGLDVPERDHSDTGRDIDACVALLLDTDADDETRH